MGKSDGNIDITMRTREEGTVQTMAQMVRYMKEVDTHAQNLARSSRRAGKATKDAGKDGAGGMGKLAAGARQAMVAITGIGSAVGVIYAVKRAVSALIDEFEKIRELKGATFAASVQAGRIFQKTAALPVYAKQYGDKALETVVEQGINVAFKTAGEIPIAGQSMFYVTSALSHLPEKERLAAAEEMTRFGTVHEMTSEEMAGLPQLWKVEGAETGKEMRDVMNKLYVGVGESISEFGEALKYFPRLRAVQKQYDLSFEESLSMYTGALDIMNAARAGQTSMIATELGIGRTKKSLHYLRRVARDQGITNYDALSPAERTKVMGAHIGQLVEEKDWKGVTEYFMAMGGGRGSGRMAFMQYSDTSRAKMESTRARLEETEGQDLLGDVYAAYDKTPSARRRRTDTMMFKSDVERGYENAGLAIHNELVDKVVERLHEQARDPAQLAMITRMFGDMGAEAFRKNIGGKMIEASLTGVKPGDPNYERAREIRGMGPQMWTTKPELMNEIMEITGDMQTWSEGKIQVRPGLFDRHPGPGYMTPIDYDPLPIPAARSGAFAEAMKSVFGAEHLEAVKKQTEALNRNTDAIERNKAGVRVEVQSLLRPPKSVFGEAKPELARERVEAPVEVESLTAPASKSVLGVDKPGVVKERAEAPVEVRSLTAPVSKEFMPLPEVAKERTEVESLTAPASKEFMPLPGVVKERTESPVEVRSLTPPAAVPVPPTAAGGVDETAFGAWYLGHAQKWRLDPDPDHPLQHYDYRAAYKAGATPDSEGHWPSTFKEDTHPRLIVDGTNTKTGEVAKAQTVAIREHTEALKENTRALRERNIGAAEVRPGGQPFAEMRSGNGDQ